MPVQNAEIAAALNEIADLLDIQGANPFRIRAYRNAARTVSELGRSVLAMVARNADLAAVPGVAGAVAAGSLRRRRETVGDLDLLVSLNGDSAVMDRFVQGEDVNQVLLQGGTRASVVLKSGLQVDLRAVPAESFGAAWVYFTGSKAHNIALRRLAQEQGLKINEYGVFRGIERIAGVTEASLYQAVGLRYLEPELREDRGEIEAARQGRLPLLVTLADLRGDLHMHTRESDGRDSLEAMAAAAQAQGLRYMAVTDHSRRLAFARGLDPVRLARQTERVLRAMDNRYFTLLAHPTGRLIGGCFVELNAQPARLDLTDSACQMAKAEGVLVSINSNAHGTLEFNHLPSGIDQGRRGWLEKADVLNTRELQELRPLLARTMR